MSVLIECIESFEFTMRRENQWKLDDHIQFLITALLWLSTWQRILKKRLLIISVFLFIFHFNKNKNFIEELEQNFSISLKFTIEMIAVAPFCLPSSITLSVRVWLCSSVCKSKFIEMPPFKRLISMKTSFSIRFNRYIYRSINRYNLWFNLAVEKFRA